MKKTVSISLNKQQFILEEDAFNKLESYLESLKKYFNKYDDASEIIADIESRCAELLKEKSAQEGNVFTLNDVDGVIKQLGTVSDITGEEIEEDNKIENNKIDQSDFLKKKLMRDKSNAKLGGVASGLSSYFNIDVTIIRLLFVLPIVLNFFVWDYSGLLFNAPIVIYAVLWLILPEAKTYNDRLQMRGEPINLRELNKKIGTEINNVAGKKYLSKFGEVIAKAFRISLRVFGYLMVAGSVLGLIVLITIYTAVLSSSSVVLSEFELGTFIGSSEVVIIMTILLILAAIPTLFTMQLGDSLAKMQNNFKTGFTITLLTVWVAALVIITSLVILGVKTVDSRVDNYKKKVEQAKVEKVVSLENLRELKFNSQIEDSYNVEVYQVPADQAEYAVISTNTYDEAMISTLNESGHFEVTQSQQNEWLPRIRSEIFGSDSKIKVYVKHIETVTVEGNMHIEFKDYNDTTLKIVTTNYAVDVTGELNVQNLTLQNNSNVSVKLSGKTDKLALFNDIGSMHLSLLDLEIRELELANTGYLSGAVYVTERIYGDINGNANLSYRGEPKVEVTGQNSFNVIRSFEDNSLSPEAEESTDTDLVE